MEKTFNIPERLDKFVDWLSISRDQWKRKCTDAKLELKQQVLATKRARDGRALLKQELVEAKSRITDMEILIKDQSEQLEALKKKSLFTLMM